MTSIVSLWLAIGFAASALLKARRADASASALATYGIAGARASRLALWALVSLELVLACSLAAGLAWARWGALAVLLVFVLATSLALLAGRAGRPCACFGSASRLRRTTPLRALALALGAAVLALGWLGQAPSGYERWMTAALSLTVAGLAALGAAVLALAREVGVLRLATGSRGALEIPEEGPAEGSREAWGLAWPAGPRALLRLAVFTSEACPLCRQVAPAVAHVSRDPLLAVRLLDEVADAGAWSQARVPGAPFAVALDLDGTVLAKGTFNDLGQLESIVSTARSRAGAVALAA